MVINTILASPNTLQPCTPIPTDHLLICIAHPSGGNQLLETTPQKTTISIYGTLQSYDFSLIHFTRVATDYLPCKLVPLIKPITLTSHLVNRTG